MKIYSKHFPNPLIQTQYCIVKIYQRIIFVLNIEIQICQLSFIISYKSSTNILYIQKAGSLCAHEMTNSDKTFFLTENEFALSLNFFHLNLKCIILN